jgi:hypothetical protein
MTSRRSQPLPLAVDPVVDADEIARFEGAVVRGPGPADCWIFTRAIGGDGYGRWWVRRDGRRIMQRANRYALSVSLKGEVLLSWERALHGCDVPLCVRVSEPGELGLRHVFAGSQRDNMEQMGRSGRGGGRLAIRRGGAGVLARRERSVALRAAVRGGWNAEAVADALGGVGEPTLW